jgi:inner membrane protein involved in colicin E2 resistance
MKASELLKRLKEVEIPFNAELTDGEFGPMTQNLVSIKHGAPFIVLSFGNEEGIKTDEAISTLEKLASETPFDPTITNARLGDNHQELQKVYHEPPVTILDFE